MKVRLSKCCNADVVHHSFYTSVCSKCNQQEEGVEVENPCTYCGWHGEVTKRVGYSVECGGCGKLYLTEHDLIQGATYRGKRSRVITNPFHVGHGQHPDRVILWLGASQLQYDSYSIANGRNYPRVDKWQFLKWAKELVSLPEKSNEQAS